MTQMFNGLEAPRRRTLSTLVGLGAVLTVAGILALVWAYASTIATVLVAGLMLFAGGVLQLVYAYHQRGRHHPAGTALIGILYLVVGALLAARPALGAVAITLLLGAFFWAGGLSRIANAFILRGGGWGWSVLSGLVSIALGVVVFVSWPISAAWLIGTLIGIDLVFTGTTLVGLAFDSRRLAAAIAPERRPPRRRATDFERHPPLS